MRRYFVIVAGGKGLRMGSDVPKQFIAVNGLPVLMHTILRLHDSCPEAEVILVLPQDHVEMWNQLVEQYKFPLKVSVAYGGETRFHSVKNGLSLVPQHEESLVAIHDGVRPLVSSNVVCRCFTEAEKSGAVIPVVRPVESVRLENSNGESTPFNRDYCYLVQTPQTFRYSVLHKAYNQEFKLQFTDDASVVEAMGHKVTLVEGNRENIKLTTPFDLTIAQALLNK